MLTASGPCPGWPTWRRTRGLSRTLQGKPRLPEPPPTLSPTLLLLVPCSLRCFTSVGLKGKVGLKSNVVSLFLAEDAPKNEEASKEGEKEAKKEGEAEKNGKEPVSANNEVQMFVGVSLDGEKRVRRLRFNLCVTRR